MKKRILIFSGTILSVAVFVVVIGHSAMAAEQSDLENSQSQVVMKNIQYPIEGLDNCQSQEDCAVFCDQAANVGACLSFAEKQSLMSEEELTAAKNFQAVGMVGPGGCKGKEVCEAYCGSKDNVESCVSFAEKNGLMSEQKLGETKKAAAAIKQSAKPLSCRSQRECDKYCASAEGMEECINFGTEAGILPAQDQTNARKVLTAIKNGAVPPCHGKECESYCRDNSEHATECGTFAAAAGIASPPKMRQIQKMLTAIQEGTVLPSCSGEQECQDYCSQEAHFEECVKFAEATGVMTADEAKAARKTGGEGPGGCKTKDECDAFCNNLDNSEACFNFAKDNGLISAEDQKKIETSQQKLKKSFNNMPAEVSGCLNSSLGTDNIEKLKSGNAMPGQKMAEQMKACFEQYGDPVPSGEKPGGQKQGAQPGQPSQPAKPSDAVNPTKCSQDCEGEGNNCMSGAERDRQACLASHSECDNDCQGGSDAAQSNRCAEQCKAKMAPCYDAASAKDGACRTKKDECVTQCQKAAKPEKPQPPAKPQQSGSSAQPPAQPSQPRPPAQPQPPAKPPKPDQSGQTGETAKPAKPEKPQPPTQPSQPQQPPVQPQPPSQPQPQPPVRTN